MDSLGLTSDQLATYFDTLRSSHDVSTVFRVLDANSKYLGTVEAAEAGQIDGDASADIPLTLSGVTLLDPDGYLDAPGMNRIIQVRYSVAVPDLGVTVDCPVFTGPVTRPPGRDHDEVTVEAQSMETVAARPTSPKTYPAANAVATIKQILSEKCGQSRFAFPSLKDKLEDRVQVGREDQLLPLVQCQEIARSLDRQLFCDGGGVWQLRDYPERPVLDLDGLVVRRQPAEPPSTIVNQWRVVGKRPKTMTVVVALPDANPFSPDSLAIGGVRSTGVFEQSEQNNRLNTPAKVRQRANRLRSRGAAALVERTNLDIVPVPNLHLYDPLSDGSDVHTLRTFTLPLGASGEMTVGYSTVVGRR